VVLGVVLAAIALAEFPRSLVPGEALAAGDHRHEVHADQAGPLARFPLECRQVEIAVRRVSDDGVRHAVVADRSGERPRIDAGQADDAATAQPLVEVAAGAMVGRIGDGGVEDHAACAGRRRHADGLDVLLVGSHVSDVWKREGDDLARIGGIGQDFFVSGHGGIEAHLADRMAGRAQAEALDHGAVRQHQERGGFGLRPAGIGMIAHGA
jgi:hypothetical protein